MSRGAESSQQGAMSDDEKWVRKMVTDVYEELQNLSTVEESLDFVALWRSVLPDAFTPKFLSLGQQLHQDVLVTDEVKRGTIKKLRLDKRSTQDHPINLVSDVAIPFQSYSRDLLSRYNDATFKQLVVDGLFLLTLLNNHTGIWIYIQRKRKVPLNNPSADIGAIVGDVFMVQNRIRTSVLHFLISGNLPHQNFGQDMLDFCSMFAPFYYPKELTKNPQEYDHLLDLAYHLAAPKPESQPTPNLLLDILEQVFIYLLLLIWILFWACVYLIVLPSELILSLISSMLLGKASWLGIIVTYEVRTQLGLVEFMRSVVDLFHYVPASFLHWLSCRSFLHWLSPCLCCITKHFLKMNRKVAERRRGCFQKKDSTISLHEWTGTASQLHEAGFQIQPTEGGISSFEFDGEGFIYYLPRIQLHPVMSEIIIPNLVAHESPETNNHFAWHILLMTALIHTDEDVKVLKNEGIIHSTFQNDADVVKLFEAIKPATEYINGPININKKWSELKTKTKEAKERYDGIKKLLAILVIFFRVLAVLGIAFVFYPFILRTILQLSCSTIFGPYVENCKGEDGTNNYLVSSA